LDQEQLLIAITTAGYPGNPRRMADLAAASADDEIPVIGIVRF